MVLIQLTRCAKPYSVDVRLDENEMRTISRALYSLTNKMHPDSSDKELGTKLYHQFFQLNGLITYGAFPNEDLED